jgi:hypothetical protein
MRNSHPLVATSRDVWHLPRKAIRVVGLSVLLVFSGPSCRLMKGASGVPTPNASEVTWTDTLGSDSIELSFTIPSRARLGDAVAMTVKARNQSHSDQELQYTSTQPITIAVRDDSGRLVWSLPRTGPWQGDLIEHLAPGKSRTFVGEWKQRDMSGMQVPPGTYSVAMTITCCPVSRLGRPLQITIVR